MKRIMRLILGSLGAIALLSGSAQAQEDDGPNIAFIEIFGCNYNAGNDMGDFLAATESWSEWADQRNVTNYAAQILTPHYYSDAFPYDVIWLGVYPSAEAMGAGDAQWLAEGGEVAAEFGEVVSCSIHAQFVGIPTNIPEDPPAESDEVALIAFQDCSLENERTVPEALQAHGEWGDFLAERGSDLFMGSLIPIAGENPDADYNYKAVTAYPSAVAYGQALAAIGDGGLQRANQLFGRTVQCDIPRIYTSNTVREIAGDE